MTKGPEEGLWPWADKCPGCDQPGRHGVRLGIMLDGEEVFQVDVNLCDYHHQEASVQGESEERDVARAEVEAVLGDRWDNHAKPAMDATIISMGGDPLPKWEEAVMTWPQVNHG